VTGPRRVELVRSVHEAFNRGDTETMLSLIDPECEIRDPGRTGGTFRGHEGLLRFLEEWMEIWDSYRVEVEEYRETDELIVALLMQTGRGTGSGIEVRQPMTQLLWVRDGKVAGLEIYTDRAEALRAAGLDA
jgi:ketosteroid isomerase-like protein